MVSAFRWTAARVAAWGWHSPKTRAIAPQARRYYPWQGKYEPRLPIRSRSLSMSPKSVSSSTGLKAEVDFIDSPVFKLLVASSLLARPFTESIGPDHDLTLPEWRALVALHAKGALSNTEVSELTGLDAMTVSRALDRLRRNGRVERSRDEIDGRRQNNKMTAAGRVTYRAVVKLARQRQKEMTAGLGGSDVVALELTLDKIIAAIKSL